MRIHATGFATQELLDRFDIHRRVFDRRLIKVCSQYITVERFEDFARSFIGREVFCNILPGPIVMFFLDGRRFIYGRQV